MNTKTVQPGGTTARTRQTSSRAQSRPPFYCPFCSKPLHLHGRVGDSDKPYTVYCERNALRVLRDGLRDYAMDTSLDFDSATRQVRLGDLIAMARKLIDGEMTLSSETKR